MIKLKKAEANNFLSFDEVSLDLENQGLVLVEGENQSNDSSESNGSGKTSILSTITFALYGITLNDTKGDDVIKRGKKKNCWVKLYFESDKDSYRIERYRKDKENKNKVKVFVNDNEITESSNSKTDSMIVTLMGVDFETYVNAVVYSNNFSNLSFMQATDKGKKEILETLANSAIYSRAQDSSKILAKDTQEKIASITDKLKDIESKISYIKDTYDYKYKIYLADKEKLEETKNKANADEMALTTLTNEKEPILDDLGKRKNYLDNLNNNYQQELSKLNESVRELNSIKNTGINLKNNLSNLTNQLNSQNDNMNSLLSSPYCYVCGALLDEEHLNKEKEKINVEISNINNQSMSIKQDIVKAREDYKHMSTVIETYKENVPNDVSSELYKVQSSIEDINKQINQAKVTADTSKGILSRLNTVKPELDTNKVSSLQKDKDKYSKELLKLEGIKKGYDTLSTQVFSDSGIKSYLMDMVTPFINEHANNYLSTLTSGDIQIELQTQSETKSGDLREKMDVVIDSVSGAETYKACSAGERKRIDLAMAFSIQDLLLSQSNLSINVAIYDECFDGLDSIGCENVIEILRNKQEQLGTIFVMSHNEHLKPLFSKVMTVIKNKNGDSHIKD